MLQNDASSSQFSSHESHGTAHPVRPSRRSPKQKVTLSLPTPLIERLRNAVYWTGDRSLASLVEEALEVLVTEMEESNREAFPQRLSPLKAGRPQGKHASVPSPVVSYRKSGT